MATWVRNGTGTYPSNTDAAVLGTMELDNGTAPGDFDADAVNSVRIQYSMEVVSGTFSSPEDHTVLRDVNLQLDGVGTIIATVNGTPTDLDNGTTPIATDLTDSSIATGFSNAQWEGAELNPVDVATVLAWTTYNQNMGKDGVTVGIVSGSVTVTIDYTPGGGTDDTAVLTSLAATSTFDATTTVNDVNATSVQTALAASATFDAVTAVGATNATAVLTALAPTFTFDSLTVTGEVNATATLTALAATSTFDAVTASGSVSLPYTYDFTGTNSDPWENVWTTDVANSTVDIQSNEGSMVTGSSNLDYASAVADGLPAVQDADVLVYIDPETDVNAHDIFVMLRSDATFGSAGIPDNCYRWNFHMRGSSTYSLVRRRVATTNTNLVDDPTTQRTSGTNSFWVRFQVEDSGTDVILRGKSWDDGSSEPGSWDWTHTDTSPGALLGATGYPHLLNLSQTTAVSDAAVDGFEYDELAAVGDATPTPAALTVTATFDAVAAVGEVNATATLTALVATATFDATTTTNNVNADAPLTALAATSVFDAATVQNDVNDSTALTVLAVASTFDPVTTVNDVNADTPLTVLAATSTFDAVTVQNDVNAATTLTTLPVASTFDAVVTANDVNADVATNALPVTATFDAVTATGSAPGTAVLTALAATATFDPVTAVGEVNAATTLTALPVTSTFPSVTADATGDATATATILTVSATFDAVTATGSTHATATATTLAAAATFDAATATGETNATAPLTALPATATFDAVTVTGEQSVDVTATTLAATATFDPVAASGETPGTATLTTLAVTSTFGTVTYTIDSLAELTALEIRATIPLVVTEAGAGATLTALAVGSTFPDHDIAFNTVIWTDGKLATAATAGTMTTATTGGSTTATTTGGTTAASKTDHDLVTASSGGSLKP